MNNLTAGSELQPEGLKQIHEAKKIFAGAVVKMEGDLEWPES